MSRVTTAYASDYARARVHVSRLYRYERRSLTADFRGALPEGVSVKCVTWYCYSPWIGVMSNAVCTDTSGSVTIMAADAGRCWLKCEAELTDGGVLAQMYTLQVAPAPYFEGEPLATQGAYRLHACAAPPEQFSGELSLHYDGSGFAEIDIDFFSDHPGGTPYTTPGLIVSSVAWTSEWYEDGNTSGTPTSTKTGTESDLTPQYDEGATYVFFEARVNDQSQSGSMIGAIVLAAEVETSAGNLSLSRTFTPNDV